MTLLMGIYWIGTVSILGAVMPLFLLWWSVDDVSH